MTAPATTFGAILLGFRPAMLPQGTCTVLVDPVGYVYFVTDPNGQFSHQTPVGTSWAWVGTTLRCQAALLDGAPGDLISLTDAIDVSIGGV